MSFPAFLDTCAVYGVTVTDVLLRLADEGAFRPLWSEEVLEELRRNLVKNGVDPMAVGRRIAAMTEHFPDAMVEGYGSLVEGMTCHPKDRHVLAAAARANAEVLVTFNVKDFPPLSVAGLDIEVVHPDAFLLDQLDLYPGKTMRVLQSMVEIYDSPPLNMSDLLRILSSAGVPEFADEARRHI